MTLDEYIENLSGRRVAVVGLGVSNRPLVELLLSRGVSVTARDKSSREKLGAYADRLEAAGARLILGDGYLSGLDEDVVFRTPGLHPFTPELREAAARGSLITSEMEAFFALCPCRTIAVTGSDGKTTTTTLISELLKDAGYTVHLGGNIGRPLLCETPDMAPGDFAVLELSSFQLHSMYCRPDIAVVTNVAPNHLDIHPSFQDYVDAKRAIFKNQDGSCRLVLNLDNEYTASFAGDARADVRFFSRRETVADGFFCGAGMIYMMKNSMPTAVTGEKDVLIPGVHNIENYLAAFSAVEGLVPVASMRRVAKSFKGVEHRLETVRVLRGVKYINDSIGTSPSRTMAGLRALDTKPILIAGGKDKGLSFAELADEICRRARALILTGWTAEKIKAAVLASPYYDAANFPLIVTDDFKDAVLKAAHMAGEGDIVLLSPACTAFDSFANFAERGTYFKQIVMELE